MPYCNQCWLSQCTQRAFYLIVLEIFPEQLRTFLAHVNATQLKTAIQREPMPRSTDHSFRWLVATALILLGTAGCQFRTPAPRTPLTNNSGEMINKQFFFKKGTYSATSRQRQTSLISWAPVDTGGYYGEYIMEKGVPQAGHVNIEWEITENTLIGYRINPSFNSTTKHPTSFIEIPITKHYYYEPEKDEYQRDTNRYIKNDQRDAWMYRPYIDLDMRGMRINAAEFSLLFGIAGGVSISDVADVEWDGDHQFVGFTVNAKDAVFPEYAQGKYRFNIMAFNSDPSFKKTPYNSSTARLINVLHKIGMKENGTDQSVNYAGHWKLPVTFYTYGVPDQYMQVCRDVIKEWNLAFKKAGVIAKDATGKEVPALSLNETPLKYPFDLRYPVINWNNDRRSSMFAPLGIGEASADVSNGQFLHGSVNIWSGILEEYMNKFVASAGDSSTTSNAVLALAKMHSHLNLNGLFKDHDGLGKHSPLFNGLGIGGYLKSNDAMQTLRMAINHSTNPALRDLESNYLREMARSNPENAQKIIDKMQSLDTQDNAGYGQMFLSHVDEDLLNEATLPEGQNPWTAAMALVPLMDQNGNNEMCTRQDLIAKSAPGMCAFSSKDLVQDPDSVADALSAHNPDLERTLAEFIVQMSAAAPGTIHDEHQVLLATLKDLTMHEMGHVLGLGHNFKGNILPEHGTIAENTYQELKETYLAHKADPSKKELATTVMDYGSGVSYARLHYDDVKPGPYDIQMLKYLYLGKYPAIAEGDASDVQDFNVPEDTGVIPDKTPTDSGKIYKTAFLPACNDLDASTNVNPFCTRWDRGATAAEIVKNRFADLNARLPSTLNAFSGAKGGSGEYREAMLWYQAFQDFSQTRVFYDYMRAMLDSPHFPYRDAFAHIRTSPQALYNFSRACIDPSQAPAGFRDDFAKLALKDPAKVGTPVAQLGVDDFTVIHDLCAANELALAEWGTLLTRKGSDHNTYDIFRRYAELGQNGGEATYDWSHIWGDYKEIGSFPLRLVTLYTVTTPKPVFLWGGLMQVPIYSGNEQSYSYAALYPREFSSIISTIVTENMIIGGGKLESPTEMGTSLLYLDYFLQRNRFYSKDNFNRFPTNYIADLSGLTDFEIHLSPIIMTNVTNPNLAQSLVFKYKAEYLDFAKYQTVPIPWAYLLKDRRVIAKGIEKQMFLPVTKFRYLTDDWGYVWALDLRYQNASPDDGLKGNNAKVGIDSLYQTQVDNCYIGETGTGLSAFFTDSNPDFKGFEVQTGIALKRDLQDKFDLSLKDAFNTYYGKWNVGGNHPNPATCDEALKGIGLIVSGAALINGYWLPQAAPYMNF